MASARVRNSAKPMPGNPNGVMLSCTPLLLTKPSCMRAWLSRWMPTIPPRLAPCVGIPAKPIVPTRGLLFVCQNCHYSLHADLVGARNMTMRTLLIRQDWIGTGHLSVAPDVSSDEAKAARLTRYAELRWSSDTSPRASAGGN